MACQASVMEASVALFGMISSACLMSRKAVSGFRIPMEDEENAAFGFVTPRRWYPCERGIGVGDREYEGVGVIDWLGTAEAREMKSRA